MKTIPLTRGQFAIVDDDNYDWLNQWKWQALWSESSNGYYATRTITSRRTKNSYVSMHRLILGLHGDICGDHKNRNTLDNRKSNLRPATRLQNAQNRKVRSGSTSGYKGVHYRADKASVKCWQVRISINKKRKSFGFYSDPREAAKVYDELAVKYFGEFAVLNDI